MQYLVEQILTCLLLAGLFGLLIGWLLWGMLLRRSRERTSDLEQRVTKLSGFPAKLADLEGTHAAFVASKNEEDAKFKARIAEVEKGLAAKTAEGDELRKQLVDLGSQHEQELGGKTTEIEIRDSKIAALQSKLDDLEIRYRAALNAAEEVPALTSRLHRSEAHVVQIQDLEERLHSSVARIDELEASARDKDAEIAEHVQAHADKDVRLASLVSRIVDLEPVARRVPQLETQIAQHTVAHVEKDAHISELAPLAALVPELKASLQAQGAQVADLSAQLEQHAALQTEKDAHIGTLLSRLSELQPLASANAALTAELESVKQQRLAVMAELEQAKAEPLKARAAAASMGFYDASNGGATSVTREGPQDEVRKFERRIEDLRKREVAKDEEIAKLQSRLTDVETALDPDTRRQIVLSAKNAELAQLRGMLNSLFQPLNHDEVALRAYCYAQERGFNGGSPTEDWLRAERDSHFSRLASAWESTRPGTMF